GASAAKSPCACPQLHCDRSVASDIRKMPTCKTGFFITGYTPPSAEFRTVSHRPKPRCCAACKPRSPRSAPARAFRLAIENGYECFKTESEEGLACAADPLSDARAHQGPRDQQYPGASSARRGNL